jgi:hypothetical protein
MNRPVLEERPSTTTGTRTTTRNVATRHEKPHENPTYQRGKKAKPSGGCGDRFGKADRTTPWRFAPPPLLRGNIFIKRGAATLHEKMR